MTDDNKNVDKLIKYHTKTKIKLMLDKARVNRRDYLILLTLWKTGIRNSELVELQKRDINVEDKRIIIRLGKGKKQRWVPIKDNLLSLLLYHSTNLDSNDKLFNLTTASIRNIVHKYQIEYSKPHMWRHSYAVHCLKSGMNIRSLQKILGHKDLNTTVQYLDLIGQDIVDDYNKVDFD